ncbi:hypothetical protein TVAG_100560 [Trichomonas vaginalis G3]|uniref:Uncharacterized protein n=1 Tax=Trichomonas vaginalis (strain ATCC PRA-98 / G3) TaxID=412133 RepID=A2ENN3_TRIV3|nr:armadillo (ARM) repeat-containing protein family [Trichomonas vaginalis G3]EAY05733.1 hypothetical protein TVAG_100560 [Trichomonas vaginalis G3]KAI5535159.1 armadillo (ARM) repeat-containing protein family [Trichomonas vaginalis G3]|eukprot:XP_001317956.1 hypothetical protein [Trichomonas vaginalis G3]
MTDFDEFILQSINLIRDQQNPEQQMEASSQVDQFLNNENSIFALMNVISNQSESYYKMYCLNYMCIALKRHTWVECCKNDEFIPKLKEIIFNILENETDNDILNYLCNLFERIVAELLTHVQWPEILELCFNLLQKESNKTRFALSFVASIFGNLSVDSQIELFPHISEIIKQYMFANTELNRIAAVHLFSEVARSLDNPDDWQNIDGFDQILKTLVTSCIEQNRSIKECNVVFKAMGAVLNLHYSYLSLLAPEFLNYSMEVLVSDNIKLPIRLSVCKLAKKALSYSLDMTGGEGYDILSMFNVIVSLAMTASQVEDDIYDFGSCEKIISILSVYIEPESILYVINDYIEKGYANIIRVIGACFPACKDYFSANFPLEILQNGFCIENSRELESASLFLDDLISYCFPTVMTYYEQLVEILVTSIQNNLDNLGLKFVINVLDILIMKENTPINDAGDVIKLILEFLCQQDQSSNICGDLISLLSTTIMTLPPVEENDLQIDFDILLANQDLLTYLPRLLCAIAKHVPSLLNYVFEQLKALIENYNESELNNEVIQYMIRLIWLFPDIFAANYEEILAKLLNEIFAQENKDDSSPFVSKSKGNALFALGVLYHYTNNPNSEIYQNLEQNLVEQISNHEVNIAIGSVRSYIENTYAFDFEKFVSQMIELDFNPILTPLCLQAIKLGLLSNPKEKILNILNPLMNYLISNAIESTEIDQSSPNDQSSIIEQRQNLLQRLFECFNTISDVMGQNLESFGPNVIELLMNFITREETIVKSCSAVSLSYFMMNVGFYTQEQFDDFIYLIAQNCFEENPELKRSSFDSLSKIIQKLGYSEDFDDCLIVAYDVLEKKMPYFMNASCVLLHAFLKGATNVNFDQILQIVNEFQFENDEMSARILGLIAQTGNVSSNAAVHAFLLDEVYFRNYISENVNTFRSNLPDDEEIARIVSYHHGKLARILQRKGSN